MEDRLGAWIEGGKSHFAVRAPLAEHVWLCLFEGDEEKRHPMERAGEDWILVLPDVFEGALYGFRTEGEWAPERGVWCDPAKLLVDPYAKELDRRFVQNRALATFGAETAHIVPRARLLADLEPVPTRQPHFAVGGLIYELNVRGFTMLHPDVPEELRGTVAALACPAVIEHLQKLHVTAVELMPVVAWIDERHLPPLKLVNAWGYNPVAMMALDPGLCPGGVQELRDTVAALHHAGIGVLLDLVFNHSGESDLDGGVLSLRGLDDAMYAKAPDGQLINDTGCGNSLDFGNPAVRRLTLDIMRHFVSACGIDGFRFDLATIMARSPGFDPKAPIFDEMAADPLLSDRVLIAEPWDIGPGGYQLGQFPANWLEWNDRFRDDVRRFWRGDGRLGDLATRIAGSSDVFPTHNGEGACRSINFLAAHDGFTLADTVGYEHRHNWANGEGNRDGHSENLSWNNGVEGASADEGVQSKRHADIKALLGTLFVSTGTIMVTAGDEFGRSQQGNNNAYCQDNEIGWVNWVERDRELEAFTIDLAAKRAALHPHFRCFPEHVRWLTQDGKEMSVADWEAPGAGWLHYQTTHAGSSINIKIDCNQRLTKIEY